MKSYIKPSIDILEVDVSNTMLAASPSPRSSSSSGVPRSATPRPQLTYRNIATFGKVTGKTDDGLDIIDITEGLEFTDNKRGKLVFESSIAGIKYYLQPGYEGLVAGWIMVESDNKYSQNAKLVYDLCGNKLGHIPKDDLPSFNRWAGDLVIPFVGVILYGDSYDYNGNITGKAFSSSIMCFRPVDKDKLLSDIHEEAMWYRDHYKKPMSYYALESYNEKMYQDYLDEQEAKRKALEEQYKEERRQRERERRARKKAEAQAQREAEQQQSE